MCEDRPEKRVSVGPWQRVYYVMLFQPAPAGHGYPIPDEGKVSRAVGVGGNDHLDAAVLAHPQINVFEVEAIGVGVTLHSHAVFGTSLENLFHVVLDGITAQEQPPRGVSNDLCVRILDGCEHALGHGGTIEIEVGMDRADHYVKLR